MTFYEYFLNLAHRPLKLVSETKSQIAIFFRVIGTQYDEARQAIYDIRRNANIVLASEKALNLHGQDRCLERYQDETIEAYRDRLLAKQEVARLSGTKAGIIKGVKVLGYEDVYIVRTADYVSSNWAEFFIVLNAKTVTELDNVNLVMREVMKLKEASAMPNVSYKYSNDMCVKTARLSTVHTPPVVGNYTCGQGVVWL